LILGGEVVDGKEAERIGLVQWSIDAEELGAKVDAIVERIAGLSPPALRQCKVCIHHASSMNPAGAEAEISGIGELMMTTEAARRVDKFVTKS
jgi:enoyl-CoA hydratase/carnithine racemase